MEIIVASNNKGKISEIRSVLNKHEIFSMSELGIDIDIEETGSTFLENALIKAKAIYNLVNKPVLSDDSGLEVECLDGKPGIYSARFSGQTLNADFHNNQLLLEKLKNETNRKARFVSVIVLYYAKDKYIFSEGIANGEILQKEEGSEGFGYDPLFFSFDLKKSFGKSSQSEKNQVSHRAKALIKLEKMIEALKY